MSLILDQHGYPLSPTQPIQATTAKMPQDWFFDAVSGGFTSDSGVRINGTTILTHGPVWQAVNILAGDVGQVPFQVFRGDDEARDHPAWQVLRNPNDLQTIAIWKETMMQYALIYGNAISQIVRRGRRIEALRLPFHPDRYGDYEVIETPTGGEILYTIRRDDGNDIVLRGSDAIHIRGLTTDGIWGHRLVDVAKNVAGHGLALQKHGNAVFRHGGRPIGVLQHPSHVSTEARDNMRAEWAQVHGGPDNAGKIGVLWEGMEFKPISISNEDNQWIEAKRLDREFVASLFNLPAFKLNSLEQSSVRANLEEQNRDYFQTSLSRHFNNFAQEFERKLLFPTERNGELTFRWDVDDFLKGDRKSRIEANAIAIQSLQLTPDEAREREGMPPLPDGAGAQPVNPNTAPTPLEGSQGEEPQARQMSHKKRVALLKDAIGRMLSSEKNQTRTLARSKNFIDSVTRYYPDRFVDMATVVLSPVFETCLSDETCGRLPELLRRHARISLADLVEIADDTTPEELKSKVAKCASGWSERADWWLEELLTGDRLCES